MGEQDLSQTAQVASCLQQVPAANSVVRRARFCLTRASSGRALGEISGEDRWPTTGTTWRASRGADKLTLKVSIRLSNAGPADVGFWNDSFRLLVDGVPRAPVSALNSSVEARSAKDAEVQFEVPVAARTLALQIADEKNSDTLPLRLEPQG